MNKILDRIYMAYEEMPNNEKLLETSEIQKALGSFFNTYFGHFSREEYDKTWCELLNIISAYQERAFETGFYAGIELMRGNKN